MGIKIDHSQVGAVLKGDLEARGAAVARGMRKAIEMGTTLLKQRTPVDQGIMRLAWEATDAGITNSAPHAGIVEAGARPHKVNEAGIQALYEWVVRHGLGKDPKDQMSIVWAIAKKLEVNGQKATYFVRDSLPELNNLAKLCVEQALAEAVK